MILFGAVLIFMGFLLHFAGKVPGMGRLPGDIYVKKGSFTFYFPIVTSLIISVILSLLLNFFGRK